jgi:BCD family chlorophyll transporter-like MFS transporter
MIFVAICASAIGGRRLGSLRMWMIVGCLASAAAMVGIILMARLGPAGPLRACVGALGVANGAFAIAAIGTMMKMASEGQRGREGARMGLWGAAQGIAFGIGGFLGTVVFDVARLFIATAATAYSVVFALEAALFALSALIAWRIGIPKVASTAPLERSSIEGGAVFPARAAAAAER